METTGHQSSTIGKVATYIRALTILLPFQLCVVGSSFAMRRFGYDNEAVSIFVAFCSNAMELLYLCSALSTFAMFALLRAILKDNQAMFNFITSGLSMVVACFSVVVSVLLLKTYALADDVDNITRYYWLLLLANFASGIDDICLYAIAANSMSQYDLGYSTGGIVVIFFHWIAIKIIECIGANVDYWLIVTQLVLTICISSIGAVLWIAFLVKDKVMEHGNSGDKKEEGVQNGSNPTWGFAIGLAKSTPMILASAVALSTLWTIHPIIAPFEMVEFKYHYPIQGICLIFHALSGLTTWMLDNVGKCVRYDWYKYPYAWWHLIWVFFIPYFGIGLLFLHCMHYPHSTLAQSVLGRQFVVGLLTVMYFTISRFFFGLTCIVIDTNAEGYEEVISPLNLACSLTAMNVMRYISEAYVQEFKLAKEGIKAGKAWPTDGMSKHSAIRYWIRIAAKVGYANFKEMASADVKQRLGGVARHIVSYRRISSIG